MAEQLPFLSSLPVLPQVPFLPRHAVGIDIGTDSIKAVELSEWAGRTRLQSYGQLSSKALYGKPFRSFQKNTLVLSSADVARAVKGILQEAGIEEKRAVLSIPDFTSFMTSFELPPVKPEELQGAVEFEARKYVPLPLSEVTFDWQVLSGRAGQGEPLNILLVTVPNETITQYQEIGRLAGLNVVGLEAEAFGLVRSSAPQEGSAVLCDMGAQSTTVNRVKTGKLLSSVSLDTAGNALTERIATSRSISLEDAEEVKKEKGIMDQELSRILTPLLDIIVGEVGREVGAQKDSVVVLAGGAALLPGFSNYVREKTRAQVEFAQPFRSVFWPPILEDTLKDMGPAWAVAAGTALRALE